jgi:hypothetical protein
LIWIGRGVHSGVAQDLHPKAFPVSPAMLPLPASQRNPLAGLKVSVSLPLSTICHFEAV